MIFSMQHRNHLNPALAAGSELGTENKGFAEGFGWESHLQLSKKSI